MLSDIKVRDLSYKETFNTGFEIFRENFKAIAILAIIVYIPLLIVERLIVLGSLIDYLTLMGLNNFDSGYISYGMVLQTIFERIMYMSAAGTLVSDAALMRALYTAAGAVFVSSVVLVPLLSSGSTYLTLNTVEKKESSVESMLSVAVSNIGKTTVTVFLASVLTGIGILLFVLPGLYLSVGFSFVIPAVIVTGKWGMSALRESFDIVRGRWFKTLFFLILSGAFKYLFEYLSSFVIRGVFAVFPRNVITDSITTIMFGILFLYFVFVECLWFINKHFVRKM